MFLQKGIKLYLFRSNLLMAPPLKVTYLFNR